MSLVYSAFVPHPPIVVPEIGKGQEQICERTLSGFKEIAKRITKAQPESLILISPHAQLLETGVTLLENEQQTGSFINFGVTGVKISYPNDLELVKLLTKNLPKTIMQKGEMDHGVLVPLYFLRQAGWAGQVVVMSMPLVDPEHYGKMLAKAIKEIPKKVALIASGDLSHRLREDGPYGYHPAGPQFDQTIIAGLTGNPDLIRQIPEEVTKEAGECGYRSLRLAISAQEGSAEIISYEGPFGVGYLVAELYHPSALAHWARICLTEYLNGEDPVTLPQPEEPEFAVKRGCFVTLKENGDLRGCIGTTQAFQKNLAAEIAHNAISAGTEDPRFWPVEKVDLSRITFSVDVLGDLEKVTDTSELDPWRYGVVVRYRGRTGLLLPHLEGVDSIEDQLRIAKQKAGLNPEDPVELWRFEVVRHYE